MKFVDSVKDFEFPYLWNLQKKCHLGSFSEIPAGSQLNAAWNHVDWVLHGLYCPGTWGTWTGNWHYDSNHVSNPGVCKPDFGSDWRSEEPPFCVEIGGDRAMLKRVGSMVRD